MAFKMKGWSPFKNYKKGYYGEGSSFNKMTDPPEKRMMKTSKPLQSIKSMQEEFNKLERKKNKTEDEIKRMNMLGDKLDAYYEDDTRG